MTHLITLPILLPLLTAVLLLALPRAPGTQRVISVAGTLALLASAALLLGRAADGAIDVYRVGDWPLPFGIALVLDRLAALMVALTAVVALGSLLHALTGADREGDHFHALFHLQLVGLNGAFLTGDIFNLFVFFEILLIASYCLLLFGNRPERVRTGLHYVALNLAGSSLFLIAVGTIYGVAGSLNMADLAVRIGALGGEDAALIRAAALLLLVVFALKAALVPLYFWLPSAYAAAAAPVAALFAIMTKVGVYAIVRIYTLVFGSAAGVAASVAEPWLLPVALVTVALGMLGALASRDLRRMQGYLLIGSVGIMLAGIGAFTAGGIGAGLYYLLHSTVTMAAMFLLADLITRSRGAGADLDAVAPLARPAVLGSLFFAGAVATTGLPPLSGFIGKALILAATPPAGRGVWLWAVVLGGGLVALLALARAGSRIFWEPVAGTPPRPLAATSLLPSAVLLVAVVLLTALAGPIAGFTRATAEQLLAPHAYVEAARLGGQR